MLIRKINYIIYKTTFINNNSLNIEIKIYQDKKSFYGIFIMNNTNISNIFIELSLFWKYNHIISHDSQKHV